MTLQRRVNDRKERRKTVQLGLVWPGLDCFAMRGKKESQLSGCGGIDERKEEEKNNFASWHGLKKR